VAMTLQEALASPEAHALYEAVVAEQFDMALGRDPAPLPSPPGDGTLVDHLLSEPTLGRIREAAAQRVADHIGRIRAVELHRARPHQAQRTEIARAQAMTERRRGGRPLRISRKGAKILESLLAVPTADERAAAQAQEPRTRAARALDELRAKPHEPDDLVPDPYGARLVEARVAAMPPEQRGWRERMAAAGCSRETIAATTGALPESPDPDDGQLEDLEPPEPTEDLVWDRHSGRLLEASVAHTPPTERGWREVLAARGLSETTIAALGGAR
jgi:hypothetical protein